ncbi:Peroxide-responsive repressor PerR [compost metagenome]
MDSRRECLTHPEIEALLRKAGINPTAQRLAICRHVLCEADHPTAEDIKHWADQNFAKLSLATVYNTLRILVDAGLLKELKLPHSESLHYDPLVRDHFHFLDVDTGQIVDLPFERVKIDAELGPEFQIEEMTLLIRGKRRFPQE